MSDSPITLAALKKGVKIIAGQAKKLKVLRAARVRIVGMLFDLNKAFILPGARESFQSLAKQISEHSQGEILLVGHTDTSGDEAANETLSLERAQMAKAYLTEDVAAWEPFFSEAKPKHQRWGTLEIQHMLASVPEPGPVHYDGKPNGLSDTKHDKAVRDFQTSKGLVVDGIAGPKTQTALIKAYMSLVGITLSNGDDIVIHGCDENFPVDQTGDSVRSPENRRVELFLFDGPITPKPASTISKSGSTDYLKWLEQVQETADLDVLDSDGFVFDLPVQKPQVLDPAVGDFEPLRDADGEPILIAANDDDLVRSIIADARNKNQNRKNDSTPKSRTFGDFIGFALVAQVRRPAIRMDHGFLDDGKGNLDTSKMESPTVSDFVALSKWRLKLLGAERIMPELIDATRAYRHFLDRSGTNLRFDYEKFVKDDGGGKFVLESSLEDATAAAIELNDISLDDDFEMQTEPIGVGGFNGRFPYPGTENWQKAIGAHVIWLEGRVQVTRTATERQFKIDMVLHAEDQYNFNPDAKDIATGTPDAENGRFEITGLGKEFLSFSTLKRTITFTTGLDPVPDPRTPPSNKTVVKPR
jgi:OmpA family/Putative peptidoglycan binding domain